MTAEIKTIWQKIGNKNNVNLATLSITDDPYTGRKLKHGKYDHIFSKMKHGQSIKCNSADTAKLSNAMREWAKRAKKKGFVRAVSYYTATTGRVFWLKEDPKM